jgi:hypothetical protein
MSTETPKDAQKGGQGAIGKQSPQGGMPSGQEQHQAPQQEKDTGHDKGRRPGQKP